MIAGEIEAPETTFVGCCKIARCDPGTIPTSKLGIFVGFQTTKGTGGREGLKPATAWFEVVKLQALAAHSPYWHGLDSGFATARAQLFRGYPRADIPRAFESWEDYERRIEFMIAERGPVQPYSVQNVHHLPPAERLPIDNGRTDGRRRQIVSSEHRQDRRMRPLQLLKNGRDAGKTSKVTRFDWLDLINIVEVQNRDDRRRLRIRCLPRQHPEGDKQDKRQTATGGRHKLPPAVTITNP